MEEFLKVLPLILILLMLLPPFRAHILVAGLVGGAAAVIIGGLDLATVTELFLKGVTQILGITSVLMFAATAMVLAKAGSTRAILELIQRRFGDRLELVAGAMTLVQALATYVAGIGAANTLVTAPLVATVVGFVPQLVAGMSIVSGASWATSPASAESAYISQQMQLSPVDYAAFMRPYTIAFWLIGVVLAWWGVRRRRLAGTIEPLLPSAAPAEAVPAGLKAAVAEAQAEPPEVVGGPWRRSSPFFVLLAIILLGPFVNRLVGKPIFSPALTPLWVLAVAAVALKLSPNRIGEMFIDGGLTILRYLFLVGLFLGFINLLAEIGTFSTIAGFVGLAPLRIVTAVALVAAFLIAIPSAAYTVAIDALVIPVLAAVGVPVWAFGFVGIAVAQGAMISPVQINVAATAHGFQTEIVRVIRNNLPYMPAALVVTIVLAAIVTAIR
ncbi:MAG TPA: hypothetical protein VF406_21890 [Thermodesulfobacteriota bacterium]